MPSECRGLIESLCIYFQVDSINNEVREIAENATAQSALILSNAKANSTATVELSRSSSLAQLYTTLNITNEVHKTSFVYLRTLRMMSNLKLAVDFQDLIMGNLGVADKGTVT